MSYCTVNAQYCGIQDPGMERHNYCPTSFSQLQLIGVHWFNPLDNTRSTPDYYYEGQGCDFDTFRSSGGVVVRYCKECFPDNCGRTYYQGCGRTGLYLNYADGFQDPKYKEYIATRVNMEPARDYVLNLDVQRSADPSTNHLQRDLCIYGYNGLFPIFPVDFDLISAVALDTLPRSLFSTDTMKTLVSTFRPAYHFDYLIIGPVGDHLNATGIGYVYLDNAILTDLMDSTLTPLIRYVGKDNNQCCYSDLQEHFKIVGNKPPAGVHIDWGQDPTNPIPVTFTTPNDTMTGIVPTAPYLPAGIYHFSYTWTKGACSTTDTIEVPVYLPPTCDAGPDLDFCHNYVILSPVTPDPGTLHWWSEVNSTYPGGEQVWSFSPYWSPLFLHREDQLCQGNDGRGLSDCFVNTNENYRPNCTFFPRNVTDTFQFVWNIVDVCGTWLKDTTYVRYWNYQIPLPFIQRCPDTSTVVASFSPYAIFGGDHISIQWSVSAGAHFLGSTTDSIAYLKPDGTGHSSFTFGVIVYDSSNVYCPITTASGTVIITPPASVINYTDKVYCGYTDPALYYFTFNEPISGGDPFWYDVVDYTQPDSLYRIYSNIGIDGTDNGRVRFGVDPITFQPIYYPERSQDTIVMIFHIVDHCTGDTLTTRMKVYVNMIFSRPKKIAVCGGDTTGYFYEYDALVLRNDPSDTSLHYTWSLSSGRPPVTFVGDIHNDSIRVVGPSAPGYYVIKLNVYDSDDRLCHNVWTYDTVYVPFPPSRVSLGADTQICITTPTPYTYVLNATPSDADMNANFYYGWWGVLDPRDSSGEYTFVNGCVPYDGADNGSLHIFGAIDACGTTTYRSANSSEPIISVINYGCYDFVRHVGYYCDPSLHVVTDTMRICFDYLEPVVSAGADDTLRCNAYRLEGNTSAASSANRGCFQWAQLTSMDVGLSHINIIDSRNNTAYIVGLDTVRPGLYHFQYTLGCGICARSDTVALYIPAGLHSPVITLTLDSSTLVYCDTINITVTGHGADDYMFFIHDSLVQMLSPLDTFSVLLVDTATVQAVGWVFANGCYAYSDTTMHLVLERVNRPQVRLSDTTVFCNRSSVYLWSETWGNTIWYSSADTFHHPIPGPAGIPNPDSIIISGTQFLHYIGVGYDPRAGCYSQDSVHVYFRPVNVPDPTPRLPRDTILCGYFDTAGINIHVDSSFYPGYWYSTETGVSFRPPSSPDAHLRLTTGLHHIDWLENDLGCHGSDSMLIRVTAAPRPNAGINLLHCNSILGTDTFQFSAYPAVDSLNAWGFSSWWSMADSTQSDGEFTFWNGCVPYDGSSNAWATFGPVDSCYNRVSGHAASPDAIFYLRQHGCYTFYWHVGRFCESPSRAHVDTIQVCFIREEPLVDAGPDDTARCAGYTFHGLPSLLGQTCAHWTQLTAMDPGLSHVVMYLPDSTSAILVSLDTVRPGNYHFQYTLGCGLCTKSDTVAIYIMGTNGNETLSLWSNAGVPPVVCPIDSVTFTASGADEYMFYVNGMLSSPLSRNNRFTIRTYPPDTMDVNIIAYFTGNGCAQRSDSTLRVIVERLKPPHNTIDSLTYCRGSKFWLHTTQDLHFPTLWFSSKDSFHSAQNGPFGTYESDSFGVFSLVPISLYGLTYDSLTGCVSEDTLKFYGNPIDVPVPDPSLPNDSLICNATGTIDLNMQVSNSAYPGYWLHYFDPVDIDLPTSPTTNMHFYEGTHIIRWIENDLGCIGQDSMKLQVYRQPIVIHTPDTTVCYGTFANLYFGTDGVVSHWLEDSLLMHPEQKFTQTYKMYHNEMFYIESFDSSGLCQAKDTVRVIVEQCKTDIKVPNAFTPNGDGTNDHFTIYARGLMVKFDIQIFDRWGNLIYESNDISQLNDLNKGWDGTYKGQPVELGVYVWYIKATDLEFGDQELKGNVTVIY